MDVVVVQTRRIRQEHGIWVLGVDIVHLMLQKVECDCFGCHKHCQCSETRLCLQLITTAIVAAILLGQTFTGIHASCLAIL